MKRQSRSEVDTRPKWDDPDLPVLVQIEENGVRKLEPFPSTEFSAYCQYLLETTDAPHYFADPTYNLKRKPR